MASLLAQIFKYDSYMFRIDDLKRNWLSILILALGIFFRLYAIDTIPLGLNNDAAWNGQYALKIISGQQSYQPFALEGNGRETSFVYLVASMILVFGKTTLAIKLASAIIGIMTLVLFFLFVKEYFSKNIALASFFVLSILPWHIIYSRSGWRASLVPLIVCGIFLSLVKAYKQKSYFWFASLGFFLALSFNSYDGARLLPFVFLLYLVKKIFFENGFWLRNRKGLIVTFISFFLFMLPLFFFWLRPGNFQAYWSHSSGMFFDNLQKGIWPTTVNHVWDTIGSFYQGVDGGDFFNSLMPLLDWPFNLFFTLGLLLAFWRFRKDSYFLVVVLFLVGFFSGVLAVSPASQRLLVALVPTAIFIGIGLDWFLVWLGSLSPFFTVILGCLLFSLFVLSTYYYYFSSWKRIIPGVSLDSVVVAQEVKRLKEQGYKVVIFNDAYGPYVISYLGACDQDTSCQAEDDLHWLDLSKSQSLIRDDWLEYPRLAVLAVPTLDNQQAVSDLKESFKGQTEVDSLMADLGGSQSPVAVEARFSAAKD